ncbi:hypothetical protein BCR34DRAFT_1802 [Clohesyomyces aquaticus]|uniref:Uncharacterized protein n=1 Tax=Clohesyomyces aquaticus TaxID=1231657 RepID=A0A1Y2AB00_9PLEO|nr:hypothetical protein BCR34DRAFT_1802 [Clohesyomyces aquaticus]
MASGTLVDDLRRFRTGKRTRMDAAHHGCLQHAELSRWMLIACLSSRHCLLLVDVTDVAVQNFRANLRRDRQKEARNTAPPSSIIAVVVSRARDSVSGQRVILFGLNLYKPCEAGSQLPGRGYTTSEHGPSASFSAPSACSTWCLLIKPDRTILFQPHTRPTFPSHR